MGYIKRIWKWVPAVLAVAAVGGAFVLGLHMDHKCGEGGAEHGSSASPLPPRAAAPEAPGPGQPSVPSAQTHHGKELLSWSPGSPPPPGGSTPSEARGEEGVAASASPPPPGGSTPSEARGEEGVAASAISGRVAAGLSDPSVLWLDMEAAAGDLAALHVGQAATITSVALPGKAWQGKLTFVDAVPDPSSGKGGVSIDLADPGDLRPGMRVLATFPPNHGKELLSWSPGSPPPSGGSTPSEARGEEAVAASASPSFRSELDPVYRAYFGAWETLKEDFPGVAKGAFASLADAVDGVDGAKVPLELAGKWAELAKTLGAAGRAGSQTEDISEQRVQFELASKAILEVERTFGHSGSAKHYEMFCPMAFDRGASWLQETEELANPYYGANMLRCGERRQVFDPGKTS